MDVDPATSPGSPRHQDWTYENLLKVMKPLEHELEFVLHDVSRFQEGDKVRSETLTVGNFR